MTETQDRTRTLLVLGGARSGKSRFAQEQAERSRLDLVFVATAQAYDDEMAERITRHAQSRGERWRLIEAPFDLLNVLARAEPGQLLLVDCMTLWLSNLMLRGDDLEIAVGDLDQAIAGLHSPVFFVSNEVGAGIVPDNALARLFRDAQGRLNQTLAKACDAVVFVAAGLPLQLKPSAAPVLRL